MYLKNDNVGLKNEHRSMGGFASLIMRGDVSGSPHARAGLLRRGLASVFMGGGISGSRHALAGLLMRGLVDGFARVSALVMAVAFSVAVTVFAFSIVGPAVAADSAGDAALKAVLQKRLLVPDSKNIQLGPPSPGPFAGMSSRTVTLANPQSPDQKVEIEVFTDDTGKRVLIAQHYAVVDSANPWEQIDVKELHLEDRATIGPATAPITIVEFGDFQCPYCARAFNEIETVVNTTHKDRVRLIWKNFPLNVHPWAEQGAVAAECAREQNPASFWTFARNLYRDQNEINPQNLRTHIDSYVGSLGLDTKAMNACILGKTAEARVAQDMKDGTAAHISSTPTFLINGIPVIGLPSSNVFDFVINGQLQERHASK
jgi:protein-disulfide isomerase